MKPYRHQQARSIEVRLAVFDPADRWLLHDDECRCVLCRKHKGRNAKKRPSR